jgi:hypothetical protein
MKVLRIDTVDAGWTAAARAMLGQVNDGKSVRLGTLFGFDLCALGATGQPIGWESLRSAWQGLSQWARDDFTETSALYLIERGLIKEPLIGRGLKARYRTARYPMSAELGLLLWARESPAFVVATHQAPRIPPVTYFQVQGSNAIVEEVLELADGGSVQEPLAILYHYRLLSQASDPRRPRPAGTASPDQLLRLCRGRRAGSMPAGHPGQQRGSPRRRAADLGLPQRARADQRRERPRDRMGRHARFPASMTRPASSRRGWSGRGPG